MLVDEKMNNVDEIGFDQAVWLVGEIAILLDIQLRDKRHFPRTGRIICWLIGCGYITHFGCPPQKPHDVFVFFQTHGRGEGGQSFISGTILLVFLPTISQIYSNLSNSLLLPFILKVFQNMHWIKKKEHGSICQPLKSTVRHGKVNAIYFGKQEGFDTLMVIEMICWM